MQCYWVLACYVDRVLHEHTQSKVYFHLLLTVFVHCSLLTNLRVVVMLTSLRESHAFNLLDCSLSSSKYDHSSMVPVWASYGLYHGKSAVLDSA